ncbi:MAG: DUF2156 domain-containing protein [Deltaproteobacteria bacterium]|nr:DUF2156 domain-containing protein [Deltaproteobacteria bacterium]MBW2676357.1 DUF2156 domain-containing protein [Deltaproteobacteria bacterium]
MPLSFEPLSLARQTQYLEFLRACPVKPSDYSFVNLWGWSEFYGLEWSFDRELVWIRQTRPEVKFWAPVGNWGAVELYRFIMNEFPDGLTMVRVPETLMKQLETEVNSRIRVDESRGHWDYLYAATELAALQGNRFHKKKNLLNQFKKKYVHQYLDFDEALVKMALDMQENWCTWRDCEAEEALDAENRAITRVLNNWGAFENLFGGAILVDGEMAAYTIGERLSAETLLIHFEKGSPGYKGIYQAINQMFVKYTQGAHQWVNREQDLDNEGLRKAKMSYNPVDFIKKYTIHTKE